MEKKNKPEPQYKVGDAVQVFVDNTLEFYDNESIKGVIYMEQIRTKQN